MNVEQGDLQSLDGQIGIESSANYSPTLFGPGAGISSSFDLDGRMRGMGLQVGYGNNVSFGGAVAKTFTLRDLFGF